MYSKGYSFLLLAAVLLALSSTADAQQRQIERATIAPDRNEQAPTTSPVFVRGQIDEGITYGHHNKPGTDNDAFGYFNPTEPLFDAFESDLYPESAFAGTIAGDDRLYYVLQPEEGDSDLLGWYDFDAQEIGPHQAITVFDAEGNEMEVANIPQWVDAGIDTETGHMILLARAGACTTEMGGALWELNLSTLEAHFMIQFTDPDNCPLSGAYDNENNRYVGMIPDAGFEGFYQADLTTGETVGTIPLPGDMNEGTIAQFIQSASTNYYVNEDPSDNEVWFFLFEGASAYVGTSRLIEFDENGIISGSSNYGTIDANVDYVEVLTSGFPSMAPPPGEVSVEDGGTPSALEFIGIYPNPFQSAATVTIRATAGSEHVSVKAYDVLGREVAMLHDGPLSADTHRFNLQGANLPAGLYLVSVRSGDSVQTQKVVLTR